MDEDILLYFGDPVKALDDSGRVGGYLVRFSSKPNPQRDLAGDYFTAKSYLGPQDGDGAECIFDHGFPIIPSNKAVDAATLKALQALSERTFQPLKTRRDAVGIWAETVLDISDEYEKRVFGLVKAGKLGWSSGSSGHRVKRTQDGEIQRWPISEGSLTPCPCEPLNRVMTAKSLSSIKFVDLSENTKATWTAAYVNDLPDSSFAYIESGGDKDEDGKTTPRSLRHFPYKDADGNPDEAHVRNALARIPQSKVDEAGKAKALRTVRAAAKKLGIEVSDDSGKSVSLAARLTQYIEDIADDGHTREDIIKRLARETLAEPADIERILGGEVRRPNNSRLKAFSRVLNIPYDQLVKIADNQRGELRSIKGMFEEELAEHSPSIWELQSTFSCVAQKLAMAYAGSQAAGVTFDLKGKLQEAINEYSTRLAEMTQSQIEEFAAEGETDEPFYLRTIRVIDAETFALVTKAMPMDEHLALVDTAERDLLARFQANASGNGNRKARKAGMELSSKNRARLQKMKDKHKAHSDEMQSEMQMMLDDTMPKANDSEMRAAMTNHLRLRHERRSLGA